MRLFLNSFRNCITRTHLAHGFREFISEYRVPEGFVWILQDLVEHSYQGTETLSEFFAVWCWSATRPLLNFQACIVTYIPANDLWCTDIKTKAMVNVWRIYKLNLSPASHAQEMYSDIPWTHWSAGMYAVQRSQISLFPLIVENPVIRECSYSWSLRRISLLFFPWCLILEE